MFKPSTFIIDTEGDSFNPTKFHCLSAIQDGEPITFTDPDQMKDFLTQKCETIIGHNFQRADVVWTEKLLGVFLDNHRIIDTLPLSWALFPNYDRHGLYDWGERLGITKVPIDDWVNLPIERYIERCETDVKINLELWNCILDKLSLLYDNFDDLNRYVDYLSFKMKCASLQEQNKWEFDLRNAHEALTNMMQEREKRVVELSRSMPKVPILATRTIPKRLYNKEGLLTKLGESWFEQLKELELPEDTQEIEFIKEYEEPNPGSQAQIKDWLFSLGWKPSYYKYTKDKDGKEKKVPQVNKENKKGGGVYDCIKKLFEKEPALEHVEGLSTLNSRISLLEGMIRNSDNGFLKAQVAGLTNTLRFKHATIVNLPKIDLPYAKAVRGSLVAREGNILIGADLSNLEDRTKQHFIYPLDPEYVESMMSPDWDAHLDIAVIAGMMTKEEAEAYKKGDKSKKPIRDIAKNGNFAAVYGAGVKKLSITMGIPLERAKTFKESYNKRNWAVQAISDNQKIKEINGEFWLWNPVSKFWYSLREVKDIFSTLNQGTGAYVFDVWLRYVLEEYDFLIGNFHDEMVLECKNDLDIIEKVKYTITQAIQKVNEQLKLNREMDCSIQVAHKYSEVH